MLKSTFTVILRDFNARSISWWTDIITFYEDSHTESLIIVNGFQQLISDPTHLLANSSSRTDLMFKDQQNLAVDSRVHPTLHSNFYHQITHNKFYLMIEYPPPYNRLVWVYRRPNTDSITLTSLKSN